MNIKGIVKSISSKEGKKGTTYGVCVNDVWYNAFGECPVEKGNYVSIDYEDYRQFHNIKSIKKIDIEERAEVLTTQKPEVSTSAFSKDDDIHLQVCMKIASDQYISFLTRMNSKEMAAEKQITVYARQLKKEVWG